jgi:hypothetical protein
MLTPTPAAPCISDNSGQLSNDWRSLTTSIRAYRRAVYVAVRSGLLNRPEVMDKMETKFRSQVNALNKDLISCSARGFIKPVDCARRIMEMNEVMWLDPLKMM